MTIDELIKSLQVENDELKAKVAELEIEKGRLWAAVIRGRECRAPAKMLIELQKQRIAELEARVGKLENKNAVYGPIKSDPRDDPLYKQSLESLKSLDFKEGHSNEH